MNKVKAILKCKNQPTASQFNKIKGFVNRKYSDELELIWQEDDAIDEGFTLEVGEDFYDWTLEDKLDQLETKIEKLDLRDKNYLNALNQVFEDFEPRKEASEVGRVESIGDGIAKVSGLKNATYGEVLVFKSGVRGMILDIQDDFLGCILFGDDEEIYQGSPVHRTEKTAGVMVTDEMLGRVVDALGNPIDGKANFKNGEFYEIERHAPSIMDRKPVDRPLETGLLTIDAMFPIGRGQRELIIGDRQTGKTAIAIDTIINQKGKDVICIYVAIGQKASSVSQIYRNLQAHGAMEYTVIVCSTASESAAIQYVAPYTGCAIAEYFMEKGRDVLVVYDDLSKHAISYRTISLLLERSPGREAYPGDVFYLHSRLLERSAQLADKLGAGSMSALPIVETQAGDVSAYIPTNIISITDGQIFLESDLFFAGQRPAVNVGLSVSRVGGAAQSKMVKKASSTIRLELAQYREMEVFTQFASDLDETTKEQLKYGQGLMQLLRQEQYAPYADYQQALILVVAMEKLLINFEAKELKEVMKGVLEYFEDKGQDIIQELKTTKDLSDETRYKIVSLAKECLEKF
ncbi:MAG: F0F1 ATP synthase subunit alpha [Tissierellia bacterium]|nr:F0F1 ATP synthase subunit alpha [Tissierellia bacterium]